MYAFACVIDTVGVLLACFYVESWHGFGLKIGVLVCKKLAYVYKNLARSCIEVWRALKTCHVMVYLCVPRRCGGVVLILLKSMVESV